MPSDEHSSRRRRRSRDGDDVDEYGRDKRGNPSSHRDSKDPEGDREGDRSREKRRHRRSRSPRDERYGRDRDGNHDRDRDREHRRRRSRDAERRDPGSHRSRAPRGGDGEDDDDKHDDDRTNRRSSKKPTAAAAVAAVKRDGPLPSQNDSFALTTGEEPPKPKEKPNFGNTGALAAAANAVVQSDGTKLVLKYHEPPEARKPPPRDEWKLFVFKGADVLDTVPLSGRSCWLVGRETAVVDLVAEHPSISKQHAVVQFRHLERRNEYGDKIGRVRPYLIDLESANGTMLNGKRVPDSRYLELKDKDLIQFGQSSREYVLMLAPKD